MNNPKIVQLLSSLKEQGTEAVLLRVDKNGQIIMDTNTSENDANIIVCCAGDFIERNLMAQQPMVNKKREIIN